MDLPLTVHMCISNSRIIPLKWTSEESILYHSSLFPIFSPVCPGLYPTIPHHPHIIPILSPDQQSMVTLVLQKLESPALVPGTRIQPAISGQGSRIFHVVPEPTMGRLAAACQACQLRNGARPSHEAGRSLGAILGLNMWGEIWMDWDTIRMKSKKKLGGFDRTCDIWCSVELINIKYSEWIHKDLGKKNVSVNYNIYIVYICIYIYIYIYKITICTISYLVRWGYKPIHN